MPGLATYLHTHTYTHRKTTEKLQKQPIQVSPSSVLSLSATKAKASIIFGSCLIPGKYIGISRTPLPCDSPVMSRTPFLRDSPVVSRTPLSWDSPVMSRTPLPWGFLCSVQDPASL